MSNGRARRLIVAGCLVERYREEIQKKIPEVDAVVGTGELESILAAAGLAPAPAASSPFQILVSSGVETRPGKESQLGTPPLVVQDGWAVVSATPTGFTITDTSGHTVLVSETTPSPVTGIAVDTNLNAAYLVMPDSNTLLTVPLPGVSGAN